MAYAISLLQTALALLSLVSGGAPLPQNIHDQAISIANQAIVIANEEISKIQTTLPNLPKEERVFGSQAESSPLPVAEVITPSTLKVLPEASQLATGGRCYTTTHTVSVLDQNGNVISNPSVSVSASNGESVKVQNHNQGVSAYFTPLARNSKITLTFSVGNLSTQRVIETGEGLNLEQLQRSGLNFDPISLNCI